MNRTAIVSVAVLAVVIGPVAAAQSGQWGMADFSSVEAAARDGDKIAQLELGRRYEAGRGGASCDWKSAARWYGRAARSSGGGRLAYSAPVGRERYGRMVGVGRGSGSGSVVPGLPEAKRRLDNLRARSGVLPASCQKTGMRQ